MVARSPVVLESTGWQRAYRVQPGLNGGTGAICTVICTAESVRCRLIDLTAPSPEFGVLDRIIPRGMIFRKLWISSFLVDPTGFSPFQSPSSRDALDVVVRPFWDGSGALCSALRLGLRLSAYFPTLPIRGLLELRLASIDQPRS